MAKHQMTRQAWRHGDKRRQARKGKKHIMQLTVAERATLLNLLPVQAESILTARIIAKLRTDLEFTEEDIVSFGLTEGRDWSKGCPRCGSDKVDYPHVEKRLGPDRLCRECGYKGAQGPGQLFWDKDKAQDKDIEVSPKGMELVRHRLEDLASKKEFPVYLLALCDKFGAGPEV